MCRCEAGREVRTCAHKITPATGADAPTRKHACTGAQSTPDRPVERFSSSVSPPFSLSLSSGFRCKRQAYPPAAACGISQPPAAEGGGGADRQEVCLTNTKQARMRTNKPSPKIDAHAHTHSFKTPGVQEKALPHSTAPENGKQRHEQTGDLPSPTRKNASRNWGMAGGGT